MALLVAFGISLSNTSFAKENIKKKIIVTADHVNIRTEATTSNKQNIIGRVNKGDSFTFISYENGWYLIDYYGEYAYINENFGAEIIVNEEDIPNKEYNDIIVAKITDSNINVYANKNTNDIIGFVDITDTFKIINKEDDWYLIDYLGKPAYIESKYVKEKVINEENIESIQMVYLNAYSSFYSDTNGTYLLTLPKYQHLSVIKQENGYYKVSVDGVIGYVDPANTSKLTNTFVVVDLSRQMIRVYKDNKEVYRAHTITGRKKMPTDIGVFKIGHKLRDYQLTKTNFVRIWIQYNGNEGIHDASWQKHEYFVEVANDAFTRFMNKEALTYPFKHGSHGCDNLELVDAEIIYNLVNVKDNVLVIEPNTLINNNLISENDVNNYFATCKPNQKVMKLYKY